ncbi:hypothetical protein EYF80_002191 [Liparis tanakae]|uniref:Uncharacterized protein n=1 Tax=Liparis tanakae TaxID=230148 RepID=A0A4Z2JCB8_9TELE|nr:hypothetical protein EYF80_002191 [Liparis tanakae]
MVMVFFLSRRLRTTVPVLRPASSSLLLESVPGGCCTGLFGCEMKPAAKESMKTVQWKCCCSPTSLGCSEGILAAAGRAEVLALLQVSKSHDVGVVAGGPQSHMLRPFGGVSGLLRTQHAEAAQQVELEERAAAPLPSSKIRTTSSGSSGGVLQSEPPLSSAVRDGGRLLVPDDRVAARVPGGVAALAVGGALRVPGTPQQGLQGGGLVRGHGQLLFIGQHGGARLTMMNAQMMMQMRAMQTPTVIPVIDF